MNLSLNSIEISPMEEHSLMFAHGLINEELQDCTFFVSCLVVYFPEWVPSILEVLPQKRQQASF